MTSNNMNMHALDELASSIEKYYTGLSDIFDELTVSTMREIQNQIRKGQYRLSPFQLILNPNKDPLSNFHYIMKIDVNSFIFNGVCTPIQEDKLVLMALGGMLNTRMHNLHLLHSSSFGLKCRGCDYYGHIRSSQDGPISRVYKLNMANSLRIPNKDSFLRKLEPIVSNDEIMKLLKDFLYIPILYEGKDYSYIMKDWIPSSVLITDVLLNFALIQLDYQFHQLFPSFSYFRYVQEVIVTTSQIELMFESALFSLFDKLHLYGKIESIGPGDIPMPCYHGGVISITEEGQLLLV